MKILADLVINTIVPPAGVVFDRIDYVLAYADGSTSKQRGDGTERQLTFDNPIPGEATLTATSWGSDGMLLADAVQATITVPPVEAPPDGAAPVVTSITLTISQ